jgi:hypothetical protein
MPQTVFEGLSWDGSKKNWDVEYHTAEGMALHVAASAGKLEVVRFLLEKGAHPEAFGR